MEWILYRCCQVNRSLPPFFYLKKKKVNFTSCVRWRELYNLYMFSYFKLSRNLHIHHQINYNNLIIGNWVQKLTINLKYWDRKIALDCSYFKKIILLKIVGALNIPFEIEVVLSCWSKYYYYYYVLSVCLDTAYFVENWKLITENNKKIIFGLLFTAESVGMLFVSGFGALCTRLTTTLTSKISGG